jgi:DNA repair protein RecN (Recombination protein N)
VAADALSVDGPVGEALGVARAALDHRRPFVVLAERVQGLEAELADIAHEVRAMGEQVDEDPQRLADIRVRRQLLKDLVRKYGTATLDGAPDPLATASLAHVIDYAAAVEQRLDDLGSHEARVAALEAARQAAAGRLAEAEKAVGAARRRAAPDLAAAVEANLRELAMPKARVSVEVGPGAGDQVTILLAANPGTELHPLAKVASGGELARAMLAVRLVLTAGPPVLVFDEVDAGIGGEAAQAVGRALARVSADHQVLVVTHLPQVAAFADAHVTVTKRQGDDDTVSEVGPVTGTERVVELSRMMSGSPDSSAAREHAGELLGLADAERRRPAARGTREDS